MAMSLGTMEGAVSIRAWPGYAVDGTNDSGPHHRWAGHWAVPLHAWTLPEDQVLSTELGGLIQQAIETLPAAQRAVVVLRDCLAMSSGEVRELLDLSDSNQRVLLHRGRLKVRAAIGEYVERVGAGA